MSDAPQKIPHELDILLKEVTLSMRIAGALVLEGWMAGDEELQGLSLSTLAALVFSRMRKTELENLAHQENV